MDENSPVLSSTESFENYHRRNCKICRHPDRAAIEFDYLNWRSPEFIAREYDFSPRSLHRHAHALGLAKKRKVSLRSSLELIIEHASSTPPGPDNIIRAIQLYARMNDEGQIIDTPKTQVIVIAKDGMPASLPAVPGLSLPAAATNALPPAAELTQPEGQHEPQLQESSLPRGAEPQFSQVSSSILSAQPVTRCQTEFAVSH